MLCMANIRSSIAPLNNAPLIPDIFGLKEITWLQALGLNFLTGLLFSRINYNMK